MNRYFARMTIPVIAGVILTLLTIRPAEAHNPIFGVGPRVMWLNGWGLEAGLNWDKALRESRTGIAYSAEYGVTPNWTVSLNTDQIFHNTGGTEGLGDLLFRTKYRFYRNDVLGGIYQISAIGAVNFPSGKGSMSSHSTDFVGGMAADYEGRRWLLFGDTRYRLNTKGSNQISQGNVFIYDAALGFRPVETSYYQPDVVLMAELNGQVFGRQSVNGQHIAGSAGSRLFAAVGAWITYRNVAFKPGIQIPVYDHLKDNHPDFNFVFSVEVHF